MKIPKTSFSGIFPAFLAGKNFFLKIGLRHFLDIAILHLCAKNQKKLPYYMNTTRHVINTN